MSKYGIGGGREGMENIIKVCRLLQNQEPKNNVFFLLFEFG